WSTRQLYVAHFAVSDITGGRFHAFSRSSREALGLAGASASPFRVWLEDWSAAGDGSSARLRAAEGDVAVDLEVSAAKPVVAQGDRGLSRKGPEPGNASFYYSLTRMPAQRRSLSRAVAIERAVGRVAAGDRASPGGSGADRGHALLGGRRRGGWRRRRSADRGAGVCRTGRLCGVRVARRYAAVSLLPR